MQRFTLFLLLALSLFTFPSMAQACTCPERTTAESVVQADMIFIGRAMDITYPSMHKAITNFKINSIKKGVPHGTKKVSIHSDIAAFSCGVAFNPNEDYLIFATKNKGKISVSKCMPTTKLSEAEEILEELSKTK